MKRSFTKCIALGLAAMLVLGSAACGKKDETPQDTGNEAAPAEDAELAEAVSLSYTLQDAFAQAEDAPEVAAEAAILVDADTGTILYEKNAEQKMYPASMTKIVTALVALDYFKPEELVTVGTEINEVSWDSSKAGHRVGETLTMKNLIRGLIIPSGNDSANVVAAAVARRAENDENLSFGRCETIFTDLMNQKAKELGATNSHFSNAHGYHDETHYTTAEDMAIFAKTFMDNSILAEIAAEKGFSGNGADNMFTDEQSMKTQDYVWRSHNLLITDGEYNYGYATGIKTGFTNEAGDCVAASAEKDGQRLIAVVFHSADPNRWLDAKNLFEYGFNGYQKVDLATANVVIEEMPLTKHKRAEGDTLVVVYQETLTTDLPQSAAETIKMTVTYDENYTETDKDGTLRLKAPIEKGAKLGTVSFEINGKTVLETGAYAGRDVSKGTIFNRIAYFFQDLFHNLFTLKGLLTILVIVAVCVVIFIILRVISNRRRRGRLGGGYAFRSSSKMTLRSSKRRGGRRRFK